MNQAPLAAWQPEDRHQGRPRRNVEHEPVGEHVEPPCAEHGDELTSTVAMVSPDLHWNDMAPGTETSRPIAHSIEMGSTASVQRLSPTNAWVPCNDIDFDVDRLPFLGIDQIGRTSTPSRSPARHSPPPTTRTRGGGTGEPHQQEDAEEDGERAPK